MQISRTNQYCRKNRFVHKEFVCNYSFLNVHLFSIGNSNSKLMKNMEILVHEFNEQLYCINLINYITWFICNTTSLKQFQESFQRKLAENINIK
jgi:hypothetical protein